MVALKADNTNLNTIQGRLVYDPVKKVHINVFMYSVFDAFIAFILSL
jgi:hypothetical protein